MSLAINRQDAPPESDLIPSDPIARVPAACNFEPLESRLLMSVYSHHDVLIDPAPGTLSGMAPVIQSLSGDAPIVVAASSLATPSDLKASYGLVSGKGVISLSWKKNDSNATGYVVWRAIGANSTFTIVGRVSGATNTKFNDVVALANTTYVYKVAGFTASRTSDASELASVTTPMNGPGNVVAQMAADLANGGSYVSVFWTHSDPNVTGFAIYRSEAGGAFVKIGQTSGRFYADNATSPDTPYKYRVQAISVDRTSPLSSTASITTAPAMPTGLTADVGSGKAKLSWTAGDPRATGYCVWRSADGLAFKLLATVNGGSNTSYTDSTLAQGAVAYYKVLANGPGGSSTFSRIVEVRLPGTSGWSITTRFGNELVLNDAAASDRFSVSQAGPTLIFNINGVTVRQAATAGGLFVYLRGGNNSLSIDASVTTRVTVQSINGLNDDLSVFVVSATVWIDQDDTFAGSANVHRVDTFEGGVSKAPGVSLPNPGDVRNTVSVNQSLFGAGVAASDANQGQVGDCYFISTLASIANSSPSVITGSCVDMGDGTYTVRYFHDGKARFYRVSNQFAAVGAGLSSLLYANGGASGRIWVPILEKAYAFCRRDTNTYASLNGGYFGEVNDLFGLQSATFNPAAYTDAKLYGLLSTTLASGKAVEFATSLTAPNLVRAHGYSLLGVSRVNGVSLYSVRNPWGASGSALEGRTGVANLTYSQLVANFAGGTMVA